MKYLISFLIFMTVFIFTGCKSENQNDTTTQREEVIIGGFRFGSFHDDIINTANSFNYNVEQNDSHNIYLRGNIPALGINWDRMSIMFDDEIGIKQIILTRPLDSVTDDVVNQLLQSLKSQFPNASRLAYSIGVSGGGTTTYSNCNNIIDINDDKKNGYSGQAYYILDRNEFSFLICVKTH